MRYNKKLDGKQRKMNIFLYIYKKKKKKGRKEL